jgi:hypothetical protein
MVVPIGRSGWVELDGMVVAVNENFWALLAQAVS